MDSLYWVEDVNGNGGLDEPITLTDAVQMQIDEPGGAYLLLDTARTPCYLLLGDGTLFALKTVAKP